MANSGFRTFGLLREHTIDTPTITPVSANVNTTTALTITSSAFFVYLQSPSDVYTNWGSVVHTKSDWEIWTGVNGTGTLVWSTLGSTTDLISVTVPANTFSGGISYYARVKYYSYAELVSAWSDSNTAFTAQAPFIATPSIISPANGSTLYTSSIPYVLKGSAFSGTMSSFTSADWEIRNGPLETSTILWSNYSNTNNPNTIGVSAAIINSMPNIIYARVQYNGTGVVTRAWSDWVEYTLEYCTLSTPNTSTTLFAVTLAANYVNGIWYDWSNWMNTNAVWISPGGDTTTYIADYMPITLPLTVASSGTYYFNYMWDNAGQIVINGGGYINYIIVNFDFVSYGCNFQNGNNMPIGSPCVTPFSLTTGVQYLITVTGYNAPNQVPPGSGLTYAQVNTWANNPAGMCLVINGPNQNPSTNYSNTPYHVATPNVAGTVFNLRWYVGQSAPYCSTGIYYNGECHCFSP